MKKKNMMPIVIGAIVVIAGIVGAVFMFGGKKDDTVVNNVKKKEFDVESENLDSFKYMKKLSDSNLYYLGLDEVKIDGVDLLQYVNENDIQDLKKNFSKVNTYKDGGSQLYTCDDEKKCDDDIKVLFCNTTAGDKDIYIAHKDVDLNADYCDNNTTTEPEDEQTEE